MIISLIGMSGSGKTFWAKKLEKAGFKRYSIDDLIKKELKKELTILGYKGLRGVSKWMGQPYEPQYKKTSLTYLSFEEESILEVFTLLKKENATKQNIVIDTTGSVIYLNKNILNKLARLTKIIYLKTPQEIERRMYELYLKDPKPVIWGDIFQPEKGESTQQTLAHCYPRLLKFRAEHYEKLAHHTLDTSFLKSSSLTTEMLLKNINKLSS